MISAGLIYCALAAAGLAGFLLFLLRRDLGPIERMVLLVLPVVGLVFTGALLTEFLESFFRIFTDGRLAPAASLLCGYKLYYGLEEGPVLGMMYTPLAAIMYLPAVLAPTPEVAAGVGECLTMAYYFVPAAAVLVGESRRVEVSWGVAALILLSFGLMTVLVPALSGPAFWIHADAPAIGFAASACAWMQFQRSAPRFVWCLGPALLATAAVLSKQVAVPILAAIPIGALIIEGRVAGVRSLLAIVVAAAAAGGALVSAFDFEGLFLNAVSMPMRQPWKWPPPEAISRGSIALAEAAWIPMGIVICAALVGAGPKDNRACAREPALRRWWIWLIVAASMIPSSILGYVKVGGDVNALSYSVYFLAIAAHLRLLHISSHRAESHSRIPEIAQLAPLLLGSSLALQAAPEILDHLPSAARRFPQNPERIAFEYAKRHPGEVYFPFHPLISLMADGQAYHFSDGVGSRELAGMSPSGEHLRAYVPEHMRFIAFTEQADHIHRMLPEFSRRVVLRDLQGWNVFTRNDSLSNPDP